MKLTNFTPDELHAFVIGFFEVLPPWRAHYHNQIPVPKYLEDEQHYYKGGRWCGSITLLLILVGIVKLVKEVLF